MSREHKRRKAANVIFEAESGAAATLNQSRLESRADIAAEMFQNRPRRFIKGQRREGSDHPDNVMRNIQGRGNQIGKQFHYSFEYPAPSVFGFDPNLFQ